MEEPKTALVPVDPLKAQVDAIQVLNIPREERVARIEAVLGFPICAATNREGWICTNKCGKGTEQLGVEGIRCYFHGGRNQTPEAKNFKHGRFAKVKTGLPELQQKLLELDESYDVFDLREEVTKLRLLAEVMLDKGEVGPAQKFMVDAIKSAKELNDLEFQRRLVISYENVQLIVMRVVDIIQRHVPDPQVRAKVATELAQIRISSSLPKPVAAEVIDA